MKKQVMSLLLCGSLMAAAQQPVDYVNPFIGTTGLLIPEPSVPRV